MRLARLVSRLSFGALLIASSALSTRTARADEVELEDGQVIEGVVTTDARAVHVRLDYGTISFPKEEVKAIRKKESALIELDRRRAALNFEDAFAVRALAAWAADQGLTAQSRALYRVLLDLEPDDPVARERLGYRLREGRWLTEEEDMLAQGYVLYGGAWKTTAEVEALEAQRAARRAEEAEAARRAAEASARARESERERERGSSSVEREVVVLGGWGVAPRWRGHRRLRPKVSGPSRPAAPPRAPTVPVKPPPRATRARAP